MSTSDAGVLPVTAPDGNLLGILTDRDIVLRAVAEGDHHGLLVMRDPQAAADLAECSSAAIPDQSDGTLRLAEAYAASPTARFHQWFYRQEHEASENWADTCGTSRGNWRCPPDR